MSLSSLEEDIEILKDKYDTLSIFEDPDKPTDDVMDIYEAWKMYGKNPLSFLCVIDVTSARRMLAILDDLVLFKTLRYEIQTSEKTVLYDGKINNLKAGGSFSNINNINTLDEAIEFIVLNDDDMYDPDIQYFRAVNISVVWDCTEDDTLEQMYIEKTFNDRDVQSISFSVTGFGTRIIYRRNFDEIGHLLPNRIDKIEVFYRRFYSLPRIGG